MKRINVLLLLISISALAVSGCAGAATTIGGGGGSYGGGGGIAISFPVGEESSPTQPPGQTNQPRQVDVVLADEQNIEADPEIDDVTMAGYIGSNLSQAYPKHNCYQPMKPSGGDSAGQYMIFKKQLDEYRMCIDTYVKNAKNDMMKIEDKGNKALREYRMFVTRP